MRGVGTIPHHRDPQAAYADYVGSLSAWHRFVLQRSEAHHPRIRTFVATALLKGRGLEIGALHNPLRIRGRRARVEYGDRLPRDAAAELYELPVESLVDPTHLLSADDLGSIPSEQFDFLVSNHLLEHLADPITAVEEWLRVLKPGGLLFLSVPGFRGNLYDYRRDPVRIDHLRQVTGLRGRPDEVARHKREHWREVARDVELMDENSPDFATRVDDLAAVDYPIHFHVYDATSVRQILEHVQATGSCGLDVVFRYGLDYGYEVIYVIRKTTTPGRLQGGPSRVAGALLLVLVDAAARFRRLAGRLGSPGTAERGSSPTERVGQQP